MSSEGVGYAEVSIGKAVLSSSRASAAELSDLRQALLSTLEVMVTTCNPRAPDAKGLGEGFHRHLETSFLREPFFVWPTDFDVNHSVSGLDITRRSTRVREEVISLPSLRQALPAMHT